MSNFNLYSRYYDLLYNDKNTQAECEYVTKLIRMHDPISTKWLEFGAGSGRHGHIFKHSGIEWAGIERSAEMAEQAKSKGLKVYIGNIRDCKVVGQAFDAVLSLFHVISYLSKNDDVTQTFLNAAGHLKPGGLFLFDFWFSPAVLTQRPEVRTRKVEDDGTAVTRKAVPTVFWNDNTINVHYGISLRDKKTGESQEFSENHLMRHFSIPEIRIFAEISGFEFLHAEEWLTGANPGPSTWGVCCILKKK